MPRTAAGIGPGSKLVQVAVAGRLRRPRRGADTALRLAAFFGTSAEFWMGLQTDYVAVARVTAADALSRIRRYEPAH